jgi:phospholipid N-methyltransferase
VSFSDRVKLARLRLARSAELLELAGERMAAQAPRFAKLASRHENGTAPQAVSSHQLFPTPPEIAWRMVSMAGIQPGHRVLEPSAGTGRLLVRMPVDADVTAVEISPELQAVIYQDFPGVKLKAGDFLARTCADLGGPFDRIVMNPPFTRGSDVRHILHARTLLARDGHLVALCYDGVEQNKRLRPIAKSWEVLPAGSFRSEGTGAGVVLLTLDP